MRRTRDGASSPVMRVRLRARSVPRRLGDQLGQPLAVARERRATRGRRRCAGTARRSATSATTRPGRAAITTTRVDRNTASTMLWVTNTTVRPRAAHSAASSPSSRWRVNSSSAPNGSSISSRSGAVTSARAIDDAHLHAAGELARKVPRELREPDERERRARAARRRRRAATPARSSGRRTLASTRAQGISVGAWNTIASRRPGPPVAANRRPTSGASRRRRDSPAIRLSSVVLPQPDGPSSVTNSPRRDREVDRGERARAVRIGLPAPAIATTGAASSRRRDRRVRAGP